MKHALILTYNRAYWPALNAMLNALEYYGHDKLDVHILYEDDLKHVIAPLSSAGFPMRLIFSRVRELFNQDQSAYMNYKFCKYMYAQRIAKDYDAICHLDGDVLLLTNITHYFTIAAQTGLIPCALYPHAQIRLDHFKTRNPDFVAVNSPLANFPVFYNPLRHFDVLQYCWDHMPPRTQTDRLRNRELYVFNYALYYTGKLPLVLPLPGTLWVGDKYLHSERLRSDDRDMPMHVYNALGDEVAAIHHKFWKDGVAEGEIQRTEKDGIRNETMRNNIALMQNATNFFNTKLRTKL